MRSVVMTKTLMLTTMLAASGALGCSEESPADATNAGSTSGPGGMTGGTVTGTTSAGTTGGTVMGTVNGSSTTGPGGTSTTGGTTGGTTGSVTTGVGGATSAGTNTVTGGNPTTGAGGATSSSATVTTGGQASGSCNIMITSAEVSSEIPTVGIVTWSSSAAIDSASIQFGPAGSFTMNAPVDLAEAGYRTLLLGMKEQSEYSFQVVATAGAETCSSDTQSIMTGPVSNNVPNVSRQVMNEAAVSPGFIVTVPYGNGAPAFIVDKDGDVVWWYEAPNQASRARMDWEGKYMWMVTGNPFSGGQGEIRRVSMDGLEVDNNIPGTNDAHHDLAPMPGGSVAAILHGSGQGACSRIVEISASLQITDIVADVSTIYSPVMDCHPNSILYHQADDSFTVGDRNPNMYVKITRAGQVVWQLGGNNPIGDHIQAEWNVNHGHHVLPNGNFLFFNNNGAPGGENNGSPVIEFEMDYDGLSASEVFRYSSGTSTASLGDVQRLPNGNTLITYSNAGTIREVDGQGNVVQTITTDPLGYTMHRESLYGPPPK